MVRSCITARISLTLTSTHCAWNLIRSLALRYDNMATPRTMYLINVSIMLVLLSAGSPRPCLSANVLMSFIRTIYSPSNLITQAKIFETLVDRGHNVTSLLSDCTAMTGLSTKAYSNVITFKTPYSVEENRARTRAFASVIMAQSWFPSLARLDRYSTMRDAYSEGCRYLFDDERALRALRESRFDVMVTMTAVGCDIVLANYLDIPYAIVSATRRTDFSSEDSFGIPIPSSYVPYSYMTAMTDSMSFPERFVNVVQGFVVHPLIEWYLSRTVVAIKDELNIRPELSFRQLISNAELWLVQSSFAIEFAQPTGPKWIPIGGISVDRTTSPLQEVFDDFVEGSGIHGVVIFSLGTVTSLDDGMSEAIARTLSGLPQRVIWKHKGATPRCLGNNTLISEWIPQNDLLGHPKTRLMITHGGNNGIYEAVSHGVPLLVMPKGWDRDCNAARVLAKGLGVVYDPSKFTEESFRATLDEVINNYSYTANAKRAAAIMNDRLAPPSEVAAFWIEHVIKYGSDHLGLRATELNVIKLHSLDVIAFLLAVLIASAASLRYCWRYFWCNVTWSYEKLKAN